MSRLDDGHSHPYLQHNGEEWKRFMVFEQLVEETDYVISWIILLPPLLATYFLTYTFSRHLDPSKPKIYHVCTSSITTIRRCFKGQTAE